MTPSVPLHLQDQVRAPPPSPHSAPAASGAPNPSTTQPLNPSPSRFPFPRMPSVQYVRVGLCDTRPCARARISPNPQPARASPLTPPRTRWAGQRRGSASPNFGRWLQERTLRRRGSLPAAWAEHGLVDGDVGQGPMRPSPLMPDETPTHAAYQQLVDSSIRTSDKLARVSQVRAATSTSFWDNFSTSTSFGATLCAGVWLYATPHALRGVLCLAPTLSGH